MPRAGRYGGVVKEHAGPGRQPEGSETERAAAVAAILALQRSAGNAAVTRMLARAPTDAPVMLPGLNTPLTPGAGSSLSLPSRCSSTSRRGGRPRLSTRATVSWPR